MKPGLFVALVGAACVAVGFQPSSVRAQVLDPQCIRDAAKDFLFCKSVCRENFQAAKDLCRNIDHACAEACRAGREACMVGTTGNPGPLTQLQTCTTVCNDALDAERTRCKTEQCPEGSDNRDACLDACIDAGQVVAFQCRDQCREDARPGIKLCRDSFRACFKACPPATPGN